MTQARVFLLIAAIVVGCTSASPSADSVTSHPAVVPTALVTAMPPPEVTDTVLPEATRPLGPSPTPSEVPSAVATQAPQRSYSQACLGITPALPPHVDIDGLVALSGFGFSPSASYLLAAASGRRIDLGSEVPGSSILYMHVSPDRGRIAYKEGGDTAQLVVAAPNGLPIATAEWKQDWRHISGWIDDEHVLLSKRNDRRDSLLVLEPTSGQTHELLADFGSRYYPDPGPGWYWFNSSQIVYDRELSRAIYPVLENGREYLHMWDVQAGRITSVFSDTVSFGVTPIWSPDNSRVIISGPASLLAISTVGDPSLQHQELFSVDREGRVARVTFLTHEFAGVRFGEYGWSPNGRYLAFRLYAEPALYPDIYPTTRPDIPGRLAVLDTMTMEVVDYCIPGGLTTVPPIWSPDSRQIVVADYFKSDPPNASAVYLVDIDDGYAVVIAENAMPFGWMLPTP